MTAGAKQILAASIERPLRMSPRDVVGELVDILGASLVAVIGHVKSTGTVREWMRGDMEPEQADRLRLALQVALFMQAAGESKDVVDAWMRGANRLLSDAAPAIVIADAPMDTARYAVMSAARGFLGR